LKRLHIKACGGNLDGMFKALAKNNRAIHTILLRDGYSYGNQHLPRVTDEGVEALVLSRKDGLKAISLTDGVTDRGIRLVVENCPQLNKLTLSSRRFTDEGCQPLMQLRYIRVLSLLPPVNRM